MYRYYKRHCGETRIGSDSVYLRGSCVPRQVWRVLVGYLEWPEVLAMSSATRMFYHMFQAERGKARATLQQRLEDISLQCGCQPPRPTHALARLNKCPTRYFVGMRNMTHTSFKLMEEWENPGRSRNLGDVLRLVWSSFQQAYPTNEVKGMVGGGPVYARLCRVAANFGWTMTRFWRIAGFVKGPRPVVWNT